MRTSASANPSFENEDCAGEDGPSEERMLVKVVPRSLPVPQLVEKREVPKGVDEPSKLVRCGIDPARRRDCSRAWVALAADVLVESMTGIPGGRNGLVDGVGREVLERRDCCTFTPLIVATGENRDGTVPARARRAELEVLLSG